VGGELTVSAFGNHAMVYKQICLSTSGRLMSTVILLMGDNEMALLLIDCLYRVKECTPVRSC